MISPLPAVVALTSNPPNSWVAPIAPVNVTLPAPELITKLSLSPPLASKSAPKVTVPPPLVIVVAALFCKITPEVAKPIFPPAVVIATALLPPEEITMFSSPVAAV